MGPSAVCLFLLLGSTAAVTSGSSPAAAVIAATGISVLLEVGHFLGEIEDGRECTSVQRLHMWCLVLRPNDEVDGVLGCNRERRKRLLRLLGEAVLHFDGAVCAVETLVICLQPLVFIMVAIFIFHSAVSSSKPSPASSWM